MDSNVYILQSERGVAYTRDKTSYMQEAKSVGGLMGKGGGIMTGFDGNIKGHPQDNIRVTVSEYKVYNLLLASPL